MIQALLSGTLLFGVLARIRIQAVSTLPSRDGLLWFARGFLQDLALTALVGAGLVALAGRAQREARARMAMGVWTFACCFWE